MRILTRIQRAAALAAFTALMPPVVPAALAQTDQYIVKANMLVSIAQFVRFPALPPANAPFTIGILGEDPFGGALDSAAKGETIGGRSIVVRRSGNAGDLHGCQVVFMKSGGGGTFAGTNVLTVSETGSFARKGGMIDFVIRGGKVSFEINVGVMKRAGLKPSAKLIELGTAVGE